MIYLDNAATTYPKPQRVREAMSIAMKNYCANPGRSGYKMSMDTAQKVYQCREKISKFFNASGPECVIFTLNCTMSSNIVLKGILKPGDHVVVSCLEHNAVMRPINALERQGIEYTIAGVYPEDNDATLNSFRNALNNKTKLVVCIHASNVWGIRLPIERIAAMMKQYGIPIMVDAAQSAGVFPIDVSKYNIDYLCLAGHKSLYGPMGMGMLITKDDRMKTIIEGGTGTNSLSIEQPNTIPDKFESGTLNIPGILGLSEAIDFVSRKGIKNISMHEYKLIRKLYNALLEMKNIKLYMPEPNLDYFAPLLSFNIDNVYSESVAQILSKNGIAVRAGLHCAPYAHQFCGTIDTGAVRVCPSIFTKSYEIDYLISILRNKRLYNF